MATFDDPTTGPAVANALKAGGLPVVEVTFRTTAAVPAIQLIRNAVPDVLVGAGTVLDAKMARDALDAGAQFVVCPGLHRDVVEICLTEGVPVVPGALTSTELAKALQYGLAVVKVFPAERFGGTALLKDLSGPFPTLRFVPSGGVNATNMASYLSLPFVHALSGSWVIARVSTAKGDPREITQRAREAVDAVSRARGATDNA